MNQIVPTTLLFDYRMAVPACDVPSRNGTGRLLSLPDEARLPDLTGLSQLTQFAAVSIGWNPQGLALTVTVTGKKHAVQGRSDQLDNSDAVEIWIDTRPTGNVARATHYCHRLICLPADESSNGKPIAKAVPIPQQREAGTDIDVRKIQLRCHSMKSGYELEIWIPETQLYGYRQIEELRRLGFYCLVTDSELGEQPLTVSNEFPFAWNPSLWVTLELQD